MYRHYCAQRLRNLTFLTSFTCTAMLEKTQFMDPTQESASAYYNKYRKRRFFFSRLTVLTSMLVLIVTLGINISLLNSHDTSTIKSNAAGPENPQKLLPKLITGCAYLQTKSGLTVICPTPTLTQTEPINVTLPQLPPECTLESSSAGSKVNCTTRVPIPTVPVILPATCQIASQSANVVCNENNEPVAVPLPSLPGGCSYELVLNKYYVACEAK